MEMLAAGIALWAVGSLLLAVVWVATARGAARTTVPFRPPVFVPTPRAEVVDLSAAADVEPAPAPLAVPQAAQ